MRKLLIILLFLSITISGTVGVSHSYASEQSVLPNFYDNFENYEVTGNALETDSSLKQKWENNVFKGGEPIGMDSHIYNVGKVEYENGSSGNKVLHLNNTSGFDTFFYMGPSNDYRLKNFTAEFKIKFLAEGVTERSWVGLSIRKKANVHYTGTNNMMFFIQRYVENNEVTGHAHAVMGGGSTIDLEVSKDLYGDKLSIERSNYEISQNVENKDTPWLTYKLVVKDNEYCIYIDNQLILNCEFNVPNFDYFGYLSLNCCTANVLVDDFSVTVQDETLPPVIKKLDTPILTLNEEEKSISWEAIEGADFYSVKINDKEPIVVINKTSYSLAKLKKGTYSISIVANSGDFFEALDSDNSNTVRYTVGSQSTDGDGNKKQGCFSNFSLSFFIPTLFIALVILKKKASKDKV